MTLAPLLEHRADFDRLVGETDPFGKVKRDSYSTLHQDVPCRLSVGRANERTTGTTADFVQRDYVLFLLPGVEVSEGDLVVQVRDGNGAVLVESLDVTAVKVRSGRRAAHHLELELEERRGPKTWPPP